MAQRLRERATLVAQPRAALTLAPCGLGVRLLTLVIATASCRSSPNGGDGGQEGDARFVCAGAAVCDGTAVRACHAGRPGEILEECAPDRTCSLGRCTSSACAVAEEDRATLVGCAFYTFELENVTADDALPTSVLVTNPGQVVATVTLEHRVGGVWTGTTSVTVAPMRSARLSLSNSHSEAGGRAAGAAFRLTSDLPVSVAHVQSDDSGAGGATSSGGTLLLPRHVLGQRYRALTYPQAATPRLADTPGSLGGAGQLIIVGAFDGTKVTITPSATASFGPSGGAPPAAPDGKLHLTLDDGDLFTLFSTRDGADLSGTEVSADHAVAVFSGNISTTYGVAATGISSPDLAHEQLLPVAKWGTAYVAAQLTPQAGVCDPVLSPPGSSIWTVVADQPNTNVHFVTAPGGTSPARDRTIGAGEAFHLFAAGNFAVTASGPIEIMQGMDCEPSLSSAVPVAVLLTDHYFGVLPAFDTMVAIVRKAGDPVFLDGARIEDSLFQSAGGGYDVAAVPLEACPTAQQICTHHLEGKFGFTMRGMDVLASYALTAPTWEPCTSAIDTGCLN